MATRLETAKNYLISVAERAIGIDAYKKWQGYAGGKFEPTSGEYRNRKEVGIVYGLMQLAMPAVVDSVTEACSAEFPIATETTDKNYISPFLKVVLVGPSLDVATWSFVVMSQNPLEFAVFKLAANAATHVALDLGGATMHRIRNFRSQAPTTLAV